MRYGIPYKGSKNAIAKWVVEHLPQADVFIDICCGGCAVTHAAMLSGKYKSYIINDIQPGLSEFFVDCMKGLYSPELQRDFITRDEFMARKDTEPYIRYCWSFGNNGIDYIYGRDIEPYKKDYHHCIYFDDVSVMEKWGLKLHKSGKATVRERYRDYSRQIKKIMEVEGIERLQGLERVSELSDLVELNTQPYHLQSTESVSRLQSTVTPYSIDYSQVPIPHNALIYADIPYKNTICGSYEGFDHTRFYEWALKQGLIFISEYDMPKPFIPVASIEKKVLSDTSNTQKATEYLWTTPQTMQNIPQFYKDLYQYGECEQLSFL